MGNFRDLTGMRFGQLTVLGIAGKDKYNKYLYNCVCDCGKMKVTHGRNLANGSCKSCGCLNYREAENGMEITIKGRMAERA